MAIELNSNEGISHPRRSTSNYTSFSLIHLNLSSFYAVRPEFNQPCYAKRPDFEISRQMCQEFSNWEILTLWLTVIGLLVSGGGTPLEPCRVAPYVSVPRLSAIPRPPPAPQLPPLGSHPPPSTAFAPFDSALLSAAAHQVNIVKYTSWAIL